MGPQIQLLIQSSDASIIPTQTLTLSPQTTIASIKQALLPHPQSNPSQFYLTFNGKPLNDSAYLSTYNPSPLSTLILHSKLLGGGGDGGSTCAESRDCYLTMYAEKKPDKVDPNEQRLSKWTTCALSGEPLKAPIVLDKLGNLFNKEALVEALIGRKVPKAFAHIKGLKDMVSVELEEGPKGEEMRDGVRYCCPVSGLAFNGKYRFYAMRGCGHVVSGKALREVKSKEGCLVCRREVAEEDMIVVNGSEEEVEVLRKRMEEERGKVKEKRGRKEKADGKKGGDVNGVKVGSDGKVVKKFKATDVMPEGATKEVYASIFTSSRKGEFKETYSCRSLPLGRN